MVTLDFGSWTAVTEFASRQRKVRSANIERDDDKQTGSSIFAKFELLFRLLMLALQEKGRF